MDTFFNYLIYLLYSVINDVDTCPKNWDNSS